MCFGGGAPAPRPAAVSTPPPPKEEDTAVQEAAAEAARKKSRSRGYRNTILGGMLDSNQQQGKDTLGS